MPNEDKRRGVKLVLSSPSGAGKSTLAGLLMGRVPNMWLSISATTRAPRPGEQDGREYHFLSDEKFQAMVDREEFLEWAKVFDHYYGTPLKPVEDAIGAGRDVLFDVDWQGARALRAADDEVVSVFILPPSHEELERRLRARAADSDDVIAKRMSKSASEISHWPEYDYVLVNRDIEETYRQLAAILRAERMKRIRQIGLGEFAKSLAEE